MQNCSEFVQSHILLNQKIVFNMLHYLSNRNDLVAHLIIHDSDIFIIMHESRMWVNILKRCIYQLITCTLV